MRVIKTHSYYIYAYRIDGRFSTDTIELQIIEVLPFVQRKERVWNHFYWRVCAQRAKKKNGR